MKALIERVRQGYRTHAFPDAQPVLPEHFRGRPVVAEGACKAGCRECVGVCPTEAIGVKNRRASIDMGRCIFCADCVAACPKGLLGFSQDYRLAGRTREGLVVAAGREAELCAALARETQRLFKRSLRLREVSAGGCNACEADTNVLGTLVFDLGRFGIQFVASPRHADGLLITGPVTQNMRLALQKTYDATPSPKIVIAVGACAISGGLYRTHPEAGTGADALLPVDLYVPGCPPHPYTILDGLLRLLGRLPG
jgi:Ni,Fe-hydrogenase III small subunit/Pyruvate/2-oxoacid:ferredoxin oxidoreductase delta subunit